MGNFTSRISQDLNESLRQKDSTKVSILRFLISKLNNAKIAKGEELEDDEVLSEINHEVKRHLESIEAYKKGNRLDLVEKEEEELAILKSYLPSPLDDLRVAAIVDEIIGQVATDGKAEFGKVMSAVMAKVKGRADGARVAQIVKERVATGGKADG